MSNPTWSMVHPVIIFLDGAPYKLACGCRVIIDKDELDSNGLITLDGKMYQVDRYETAEDNIQNVKELCHLKSQN